MYPVEICCLGYHVEVVYEVKSGNKQGFAKDWLLGPNKLQVRTMEVNSAHADVGGLRAIADG
jgi:hypothetical protein